MREDRHYKNIGRGEHGGGGAGGGGGMQERGCGRACTTKTLVVGSAGGEGGAGERLREDRHYNYYLKIRGGG